MIPEEVEMIQGVYRRPEHDAEVVKAVATSPAPRREVAKAAETTPQPPKPPTLVEAAAKIRRESGNYLTMYSFLQAKLPELRQAEKGGMNGAIRVPPSGRARGGANAIEFILSSLKPLIEGTANPTYAAGMKKVIGQMRDAARTKANRGDIVAMGEFEQLHDIYKQL